MLFILRSLAPPNELFSLSMMLFPFPARLYYFIVHFLKRTFPLFFVLICVALASRLLPLFHYPPYIPPLLSLPTRASMRALSEPVLPQVQNGLFSEPTPVFLRRVSDTYLCPWCTYVLPCSRLCNDHDLQRKFPYAVTLRHSLEIFPATV
jgi:hypothetical protein